MKTIDDLKISKKAKLVVKTWLEEWLNTLIAQADGKEGTVYRADFINQDFFYFTNCNDILLENPEAASVESNRKIQLRKRTIMAQLFVKTLLGNLDLKKNKCSHCGYHNRYIGPLTNGHFLYCPNCYYTTIAVYPDSYNTCIAEIEKIKVEKRLNAIEGRTCAKCYFHDLPVNSPYCHACKKYSNWKKVEEGKEKLKCSTCEFNDDFNTSCDNCRNYSNWKKVKK